MANQLTDIDEIIKKCPSLCRCESVVLIFIQKNKQKTYQLINKNMVNKIYIHYDNLWTNLLTFICWAQKRALSFAKRPFYFPTDLHCAYKSVMEDRWSILKAAKQ